MTDHVELDVDPFELKEKLKRFRQGDLLDVARMSWVFSPDEPLYPEEANIDSGEPVGVNSRLSPSGLSVIVSQTCDIWKLPDVEPFVVLCPLSALSKERYAEAQRGMSVRYFPYPNIFGSEDSFFAVDARLFYSLEKTALQSAHIEHTECPLSEPQRANLRFFLGQRLGRTDFPDEIVSNLVAPIEKGFKRIASGNGFGPFFDSVIYCGIRWTPQAPGASVLVLTSHRLRDKFKVSDDDVKAALARLRKSLVHWTRDSDYDVSISVHDADQVSAHEILSHHELRLDIEAATVDP